MACIRLSGSGQTQSAAVAIRPKHKRGLPHPNNFRPTSVQFKGRINSDKARKRHQTRHLEFYTPQLLTEMLEVRILPGEPTPFSFNEL